MALRWYVIRTKPQCEHVAARVLERAGFELFFPRVRTPRPRAGRTETPLFPGYLFLHYDVDKQGWPSVRQHPGILGLVRFNGVVPPVPEDVVSGLARRVQEINREGGLWTRFRPGEMVRVVFGKIDSHAEVIDEPRSPEDRVRVLVEFMGRLVPAQVPWMSLNAAPVDTDSGQNRPGHRRTRGRGRWIRGFGPKAAVSGV